MKPPKLVLPLVSLTALAVLARADVIERVIVRVNGEIVTQSEFEARQVAAVQAARIGPADIERFLRENNAKILQDAVDELLLVQRAQELGYKISAAYLRDVIDNIKKDNKIESDEELQRQLRREGMTLDDLKRNIEHSILKNQVIQRELQPKVAVSETEVRAEYEAKKGTDYTKRATVHLQEIVLKTGPAPGDAQASRTLAGDLVKRARAGEDFAELARQHSVGATRQNGGDLGQVSQGDLSPEVDKIAFGLAAGGVSEPLKTAEGFRILKVVESSPAVVTPYEEAKADIQKRLTQGRFGTHYDTYMDGLRKNALIDLRVREVPLTVTVPAGTSILEAPSAQQPGAAPAAPAAAPADPGAEFTVTPVAPPQPSPTPTPTPPPQ
ncbi:MAG TPA: peptidylprolyl isomerase [Vicinamibacteria bacterium]